MKSILPIKQTVIRQYYQKLSQDYENRNIIIICILVCMMKKSSNDIHFMDFSAINHIHKNKQRKK